MSILIFTNKFVLCLLLDVLLLFNTFCFLDSDRWLWDGLNAHFRTERIWAKILSILGTLLFRPNSQKKFRTFQTFQRWMKSKRWNHNRPNFPSDRIFVYDRIIPKTSNFLRDFYVFKRIKNHKWNFYEPVSVLKFA